LTDYFSLPSSQSKYFNIFTKDLFVYNVMNEYLHKWKMNNWIMSRGQVAAYVDILDGLYDALVQNKISYKMIKK
jgi:ribonuclease HI